MNLIPLIILFCIAFALQYLLTFLQMKSFMGSYRSLRQKGRVAIGKAKGAFRAGAIAMFAIDGSGNILEGSCLQGVTVFARGAVRGRPYWVMPVPSRGAMSVRLTTKVSS